MKLIILLLLAYSIVSCSRPRSGTRKPVAAKTITLTVNDMSLTGSTIVFEQNLDRGSDVEELRKQLSKALTHYNFEQLKKVEMIFGIARQTSTQSVMVDDYSMQFDNGIFVIKAKYSDKELALKEQTKDGIIDVLSIRFSTSEVNKK